MKSEKLLLFATMLIVVCVPVILYTNRSNPAPIDSSVLVFNNNGHGSGVIVGPRLVLTAGHVAKHENLSVRCANGTVRKVISTVCDPNADVAVLTVDDDLHGTIASISPRNAKVPESIVTIGVPIDPNMMGSVFSGRIVHAPIRIYAWRSVEAYDAHTMAGCSGGPVFLNGRLVGIHVSHIGSVGFFVPISACREVLANAGVPLP
jgi:hypothetical protein